MAEDVDFTNPRKKIKLDEDPSRQPRQNLADTDVTGSSSEDRQNSDPSEQCQSGSSEAPKTEDLSQEAGDSDSDSSVSALSDFSDLSGEESWKAHGAGAMSWVYRNMEAGVSPRSILEQMIPDSTMIPNVDDLTLWKLVISIVSEPPPREKLPNINTIEDVIDLMKKCKNIMVLTGAGVSVSCGIPDFRSRNGVYARLAVDFPDLPDPQAMFDIRYFRNDQRPFFKFAKEIFPGQFEPSKCHKFIKLIETHGKLLRNYTQNIDTLEQVAGINNVIQCHGSFATATCMTCSYKCPGDDIKAQIMEQIIPMCPKCDPQTPLSVMKPDIVFFGESLPEEFHQQMTQDKDQCDLLIVIGSSLKVRPVALIPNSLPAHVPQILINKEPLRNLNFDVELLGDCDTIIGEVCRRLGEGWESLASRNEPLTQISVDQLLTPPATPTDPNNPQASSFGDICGSSLQSQSEPVFKIPEDSDCKTASSGKETSQVIAEQKDTEEMVTTSEETSITVTKAEQGPASREDGWVGSTDCVDVEKVSAPCASDGSVRKTPEGAREQSADTSMESSKPEQLVGRSSDSASTSASWKNFSGPITDIAEDSICGIDTNLSELHCNSNSGEKGSEVRDPLEGPAENNQDSKAGPSTEPDLKSMWQPRFSKLSVAQRLGSNQYCLIPPHRYVFKDAEVFTIVGTESDDSMGDHDDDDNDDDDSITPESDSHQSTTKAVEVDESIDNGSKDVTDTKVVPVQGVDEVSSTGENLPDVAVGDFSDQKWSTVDSGEKAGIQQENSADGKVVEEQTPSGEG